MKRTRTNAWARALALTLAIGTAGCGGQAGTTAEGYLSGEEKPTYEDPHPLPQDTMTVNVAEIGSHGGRFVIAQTNGPKTFNALMANETSSTDVTQRLFPGLAEFDNKTQQDYPMLAKSYESSEDGLTWTFHLRRGARFSDGHPITSEDVLFSFRIAFDDVLHPSIQDLLQVNGKRFEVTAPDSYTVVVETAARYALLVPAIGSVNVMPKHVLEPAYERGAFASAYNVGTAPESIVTSGPWRVKQYVPGEKTVLTRNPYWFGVDPRGQRLPYLDEMVFLIVPDQDAADLKFRAGEVDGVDNVKPENYRWYEENQKRYDYTLYELGPSLTTNFFWFNLNTVKSAKPAKKVGDPELDPVKYSWFVDPQFRRAVSMAIDREAMIRSVFFGDGVKNWSTSTAASKTWYSPDIPRFDYDPEQSRNLLANLGWKDTNGDGFLEDQRGNTVSFTLKTNSDNRMRIGMCNFIQDDLAKVGIKCTPVPIDFNTLITNIRQDFQYESILLGLGSAVPPDPGMGANVYRSSGGTHYWNLRQTKPETEHEARMNQYFDELIGTLDVSERKRAWIELQSLLNQECYLVWLPTLKLKVPVRNRFGNLSPSVIPHRLIWNIDRVFVKSRARRA